MMTRPEEPEAAPATEPMRGRIFNSLTNPRKQEEEPVLHKPEPTPEVKPEIPRRDPKPVDPVDEDDDDWGAVPAFLRRSKLK
jgi:hypothetical protein